MRTLLVILLVALSACSEIPNPIGPKLAILSDEGETMMTLNPDGSVVCGTGTQESWDAIRQKNAEDPALSQYATIMEVVRRGAGCRFK